LFGLFFWGFGLFGLFFEVLGCFQMIDILEIKNSIFVI
jgi:hypothetical protein